MTNHPSNPAATNARFHLSAWVAVLAALAYLCRNCVVVAEKTIRDDLGISEQQMAWILGPAFHWTYSIGQIPGGWLGERLGSRICLPVLSILSAVGMFVFVLPGTVILFCTGRITMAIAQAGMFPCAMHSLSRWHPQNERGIASGIMQAAMTSGSVMAAGLTASALQILTWRTTFAIFAIPAIVWGGLFYLWFRDDPSEHPSVNEAELARIHEGRPQLPSGTATHVPWRRILTSYAMWMICGQHFFRGAAYSWFTSWFATYLQETRHISQEKSGWLLTIPTLAMFVAALGAGGLSDWVLRRTGSLGIARKGVSVVGLVICAILVMWSATITDATWATCMIAVGSLFASFPGTCAYAVTMDVGGRHVGSVFSVMNTMGGLGAGLLTILVPPAREYVKQTPWLLSLCGNESWHVLPLLTAITYLIAALCWLCIPMKPIPLDDH